MFRNRTAPHWPARAGAAALGLAGTGAGLVLASELLARDAERRVPADGGFVEVEGARLHYVDQGSGPPVVAIPGLLMPLRNFTYSLAGLLAGEHRVIALDRPGTGYSVPSPGTEPTIRDQGRIVARLVEELELEKPILVGHSLGGAVALAAALAAPGRIGGLVLLAPLTQPLDVAPEMLRALQQTSWFGRAAVSRLFGVPFGRLTRRLKERRFFAPDMAPADFGERGGGLLALRPENLDAGMREIMNSRDELDALVSRYGELDLPVSILFARGDRILEPDLHGRRTAEAIPGAVFEEIEGGHMLPITHAEACARVVRATYDRVRR